MAKWQSEMGSTMSQTPSASERPKSRPLDARLQWGLFGAAALAVVIAAWKLAYAPLLAHLFDERATWRDLRAKRIAAEGLPSQAPEQDAALRQLQSRYRQLESQLSGGQSVPRILEELGARAREQSLELTVIQPRLPKSPKTVALSPGFTLRETPLSLQLSGRYRAIGEFLSALPDAPFLASISSLMLTRPEATAPLRAELALTVYTVETPTS